MNNRLHTLLMQQQPMQQQPMPVAYTQQGNMDADTQAYNDMLNRRRAELDAQRAMEQRGLQNGLYQLGQGVAPNPRQDLGAYPLMPVERFSPLGDAIRRWPMERGA